MRLSTSKHAPSGRLHRHIGRYKPHPVALARKEKALAEAAALLVLKKTVESIYQDEDEDIDGENEK